MDAARAAAKKAMAAAAAKILADERDAILSDLAERGFTEDAAARFSAIVGPEVWDEMFRPLIADAMMGGADSMQAALEALHGAGASAFDVQYSLEDIIGSSALSQRVDKLTGEVTKTTTDLIEKAVDEARMNGDDRFALADRIQEIMGADATDARALMIATTESNGATNNGAAYWADQAAQGGYGVTKLWHHLGDDEKEPREDHVAQDDGEEYPYDEDFPVTGMAFPHDPSADASDVIGCQCEVEYRLTLPDGTEQEAEGESAGE